MNKQDPSLEMLYCRRQTCCLDLGWGYTRLPSSCQIQILYMASSDWGLIHAHGSCICVYTCVCVRVRMIVSRDRNGDAEYPETFSTCGLLHVLLSFTLIPLESHGTSGGFSGILVIIRHATATARRTSQMSEDSAWELNACTSDVLRGKHVGSFLCSKPRDPSVNKPTTWFPMRNHYMSCNFSSLVLYESNFQTTCVYRNPPHIVLRVYNFATALSNCLDDGCKIEKLQTSLEIALTQDLSGHKTYLKRPTRKHSNHMSQIPSERRSGVMKRIS